MMGGGPAASGEDIALRIRCGTCNVTINVGYNLVRMLANEGYFKCPACQTRQSVNQDALNEHLRMREMEQQNQIPQFHHLHNYANPNAGATANANVPSTSQHVSPPPPPPVNPPPPSTANGGLGDLRVEGLGKRKLHPDLTNPDPIYPKRNRGLDSARPYNIPGQPAGMAPPAAQPRPVSHEPQSEDEEEDDDVARDGGEKFQDYKPSKLRIGVPHSDSVVESSSLAAAEPPDIDYELHIDDCVENGSLSCLQLEAICYACQRHEQHLAGGERSGFFIGDGAGVGKGRTIAGLILENWRCGRRRHLWVSVSGDLKHDARRDLDDVGADFIKVHPLNKMPYAPLDSHRCGAEDGVIFLTYSTLISSTEKGVRQTRLKQLLDWCGGGFDGLIVFDECHKAKNLVSDNTNTSTKTGQRVLQIQESLREARVVYCSATGATELRNMAYMVRLGLWGKSLSGFKNFNQFKDTVGGWGVGALELIAMELKARGMYLCRTLSFQGTEFKVHNIEMTPEMQRMYHRACHLWRQLLSQFQYALESLTDAEKKNNGRVWPQFWSAHQRFFRQMCIAVKVDETVKCAEEALSEGKCVVIGLQSTGEMRLSELAKEKGNEMDDFASGLKETMIHLIDNHWPLPFPPQERHVKVPQEDLPNGLTQDDMEVVRAGKTLNSSWKETNRRAPLTRAARRRSSNHCSSPNQKSERNGTSSPVETIDLYSTSSEDDGGEGASIDHGLADIDVKNEDPAPSCSPSRAQPAEPSTSNRRMTRSQIKAAKSSTPQKRKSGSPAREGAEFAKGKSSSRRYDVWGKDRNDKMDSEDGVVEDGEPNDEGPSGRGRVEEEQVNSEDESMSDSDESVSVILLDNDDEEEEEEEEVYASEHQENNSHANDSTRAATPRDGSQPTGAPNQQGQPGPFPSDDRYEIAMHYKEEVLKIINKATLPSNPLDLLVDQLGGPDKVAEMTGRRGRFVRLDDEGRVRWEARNASGVEGVSLEVINVAEAQMFMSGKKLVAIISDAASAGISLHADRRHANQKRRVHLTLELPWSADRAVQQFGRSHRSNQATGPQYRLMMTTLGGESRFAAAVAKRLQNLGALTQGDRNAGPELGSFNYDTAYGRRSLQELYNVLMGQSVPSVMPSSGAANEYPSFPDFCMDMRKHMLGVGMISPHVDAATVRDIVDGKQPAHQCIGVISQNHQLDISRFLNRLLGIQPEQQKIIFGYYLDILQDTIKAAKRDGRYDNGIKDITSKKMEFIGTPDVISTQDWGGKTLHYKVMVDRGVDYESAQEKLKKSLEQINGADQANGFYRTRRPGGGGLYYCVLALKAGDLYQIFRPSTGLGSRKISPEELKSKYIKFTCESTCMQHWNTAHCTAETSNVRIRTLNILAGDILPVWDATSKAMGHLPGRQQKQYRIVRLQSTDDNRRLVGIQVPGEVIPHIRQELEKKKNAKNANSQGAEERGHPVNDNGGVAYGGGGGGGGGGVGNGNGHAHGVYPRVFLPQGVSNLNSGSEHGPGQMNGGFSGGGGL
ncbi:hypothetical protein BSKO_13361 [Bryopsis sp. KO-2023]|nr:hypothetical protein BSKO_13361 [Bryopsis sp. KO-2023]